MAAALAVSITSLRAGVRELARTPSVAKPALATRDDGAMRRWRSNRFGLFIHWGLYALLGGEWQGKTVAGAAEWIQTEAGIPAAEYALLTRQWNPTNYQPAAWARLARDMGARYVTITTKHHEGFCLWDSAFTDFDVAATPYGRDLLGPLVKALTAEGLDVHFYFSILDWHHPDYRAAVLTPADRTVMDRYIEFVKNQLRELLTRYPEVRAFWFDGQWDTGYCEYPAYAEQLEALLRQLKPDLILNNRLGAGPIGNVDYDATGRPFGDYNAGFERFLPHPGSVPLYEWEASMTLPENQWGYRRIWTGHVKTAPELTRMLIQCASQNGNFMVNFGPKPDGAFREEELAVAKGMGQWLKANGEAIYGTHGSTLGKPRWGFITERADQDGSRVLYLHVLSRPAGNRIRLPFGPKRVRQCRVLSPFGQPCPVEAEGENAVRIALPQTLDPIATVIRVDLSP